MSTTHAFKTVFSSNLTLVAAALTGLGLLSPAAAQAQAAALQPEVQVLPPVVITAADLEQPLARTIAHTTLIEEAEIRRSGFPDLSSLLRGRAGLDFTQNGGLGTSSSIFLRGAPGTQVLVLIDGLRVGSATLGTASLDQIMLDEVDHIEIVRGNVSALYGSAAVGGVIQVFTKTGRGPARPQVSVEAGSHGTRRASAGVRGSDGDTGYALSVSRLRTDGISAQDPSRNPVVNPDADGYRNTSASASLTHKLGGGQLLGLRALASSGHAAIDNAFAASSTVEHFLDTRTAELSGFWQARWSADWTSVLRVGMSNDRSRNRTVGEDTTFFNTRTRQADLKNEIRLAPGQQLGLGLQSVQQDVDSTTPYPQTTRRVDSLTASYNAELQAVQWQLALRHDRVAGSGQSATTGLLGAALPLDEAWRLIGSVSTAFNLPTFNQLYYPDYGNANLRPERARSAEFGAQYEAGGTLLRAVAFRTRYHDLIEAPAPDYTALNVAKAVVDGFEMSASTRIDDWTLKLNYTNQDPRNADTGQILNRRADAFGSVEVLRSLGAWQLGGQVSSMSDRRDGSRMLAGYKLVHLNASWAFLPAWTLRARVTNLTNEQYQTVYGYKQPGREAFLGVSWQP